MFTRRQLRIKVMQTLYASYIAQEADPEVEADRDLSEKELFKRIHNSYQLYLYCLYLLTKVAEYVEIEEEVVTSKFLVSNQDKKVNKKILNNPVTHFLINDSSLGNNISHEELEGHYDKQVIRKVFEELKKREKYITYLDEDAALNDHQAMLNYVFYRVMLSNDDFQRHIEEIWTTWLDDIPVVSNWIKQTIYNCDPRSGNDPIMDPYGEGWKNQKQFILRLLAKTIDNKQRFEKMIAEKAKNWDVERITFIDRILMQMCLSEFLYFPSIPVKVSIDEYIEIAKNYSTPKSREFINGILDRLMRELKEAGKVKKEGKGKIG